MVALLMACAPASVIDLSTVWLHRTPDELDDAEREQLDCDSLASMYYEGEFVEIPLTACAPPQGRIALRDIRSVELLHSVPSLEGEHTYMLRIALAPPKARELRELQTVPYAYSGLSLAAFSDGALVSSAKLQGTLLLIGPARSSHDPYQFIESLGLDWEAVRLIDLERAS